MAPLAIPSIEGENLGKRHRSFNLIVHDTIKSIASFEDVKNLEAKSDIDKLVKIDIAAHFKDVDYILEVFRSDDILLVSRAIKQSTWLITDEANINIINPNYLNNTLSPRMMPKAYSKLLLHVRLNLRNEKRIEDFFNYYKAKNLKFALKWLPKCSIPIIEETVRVHYKDIDVDLFKRLCERSFSVLKIYNEETPDRYSRKNYIAAAIFLIKNNVKEYLDVMESLESRYPKLGTKYTELVMKTCPERIIEKFDKYLHSINIQAFVKSMDKNKIKEFLLKLKNDNNIKHWFRFDNIKPFIKAMPEEGKFEFLKQIFIDKTEEPQHSGDVPVMARMCASAPVLLKRKYASHTFTKSKSNIYQWYKYATFEVAFPELQKMIRTESSPDERVSMILVMVAAAHRNKKNIETVLKFFLEKHINEPLKFKIQVVNGIISTKAPYRFEEASWKILDEIFHSMDVYTESDNNDSDCVECIVLYKIFHNELIPEIIEKKFKRFRFFKNYKHKFNDEEKMKIFNYLCQQKEFNKPSIEDKDELSFVLDIFSDILDLLNGSKKNLSDYPDLIKKIKELIKLSKEKSWNLYVDINKKWRKCFFEESLILSRSENTCTNALKHDPQLLTRYKSDVEALMFDDKESLQQVLRKLKLYFSESLCQDWINAYENRLEQRGSQNALTRGLCVLLPPNKLVELITKFAPADKKIVWSEVDEIHLSIQKQLAKNMHIARPKPPPDAVLLYAKGDYLQFALPSLSAVFHSLSSEKSKVHIPKLLDAPVSVQKHGLRIATSKFSTTELEEVFVNIWKNAKNASIRAVIFQLTFELLCKEKSPERAEELWMVLEKFIDTLTEHDNKSIFSALGEINDVPTAIQPKFCIKSYTFLKQLPAKLECDQLVFKLANFTRNIMLSIDSNFVKNILLEYIHDMFILNQITNVSKNDYKQIVASYLVCVNNEDEFRQRYQDILQPILRYCFENWSKVHKDNYIMRDYFDTLRDSFLHVYQECFVKSEIIVPVQLYSNVLKEAQEHLHPVESYHLLTTLKLLCSFFKCLGEVKPKLNIVKPAKEYHGRDTETDPWQVMYSEVASPHGDSIIEILKSDLQAYFPSVAIHFGKTLENFISNMNLDTSHQYRICEMLLSEEEFHSGYIVAIIMLNEYVYEEKHKEKHKELLGKIKSHPSMEVKMFYHDKFPRFA